MNYEEGIVVSLETNVKLVATKLDVVVMFDDLENYNTFKLGDCLHFYAKVLQIGSCRRKILEAEKCEQLVEWEKQIDKDSAHIVSNITGISLKTEPISNRRVRCFKTNFLQEVYETDGLSVDPSLCDFELARMKVIAVRKENNKKHSFWSVLKVISVDNNTNILGQFGRDFEPRNSYSGIILAGNSNRGDNFIWVPGRDGIIRCPENIRRAYSSNTIQGKWFTFTVNQNNEIDQYSQFRLVDNVLPTRFQSNLLEIKVSIFVTDDGCRQRRTLQLESGECGVVVDRSGVLERYRRFSTFSDEAWIFCDWPNFVLSSRQDWRISRDSSYESIQFNSRELFRDNESRQFESPRNQFRTINDNESTASSSRDSENCNPYRNSRSSIFERHQAQSSSHTDQRVYFRPMNDSVSTASSRDSENCNPYRNSRSSIFERHQAQSSSHTDRRSDSSTPILWTRKRDPSVASTSENVEEKKEEELHEVRVKLDKLQKRIYYLEENDLEVSEKLLADFQKLKTKETQLTSKPKIQKNKDLKTIKKLEDKLSTHKKLVLKIREMLECPHVRFEMERFDSETMEEIDQLIFEL